MKPRCRIAGAQVQLRYNLNYDIQCSTVYPVTSPNGSTVTLLGHASGIYIIWRGGRPLKARKHVPPPKAPARPSSSDIMVIDLDSPSDDGNRGDEVPEASGQAGSPQSAEFEEEEEEIDPKTPYSPVIQTLDLPLGGSAGGVTHIAVPLLSDAAKRNLNPDMLKNHMLLAVSCADTSLRILLIPLAPPSEEAKTRKVLLDKPRLANAGNGSWGEVLVDIPGGLGHRTLISGVSLGIAARSLVVDAEDEGMETEGLKLGEASKQPLAEAWDILIASTSSDAGGTLLVHRIPLSMDGSSLNEVEVWRRVLLSSPAVSVDLHPGSATQTPTYPKVLVSEAQGSVKIYECSDDESKEDGRWVGELDAQKSMEERRAARKSVVSARFILGGFAVVALLSDGTWGVWDISRLSTQVRQRGFTYGGRMTNSSLLSSKAVSSQIPQSSKPTKSSNPSSLAPMTPHTRKVRQQALFAAGDHSSVTSGARNSNLAGRDLLAPSASPNESGISLLLTTRDTSPMSEDGHLLLWLGEAAVFVPNLRARHISQLNSGDSADGVTSSSLINVGDPFTGGSSTALAQLKSITAPDPSSLCAGARVGMSLVPSRRSTGGVKGRVPEVVIASERAVSVVGQVKTNDSSMWRRGERGVKSLELDGDDNGEESIGRAVAFGAANAIKGGAELAIDGIEGVLDGMAKGAKRLSGRF